MSRHADTRSDAVHEALDLIADYGPIAVDEVVRRLAACDYHPEPEQLIHELVAEHHVWWLADHLLLPDQVLDGAVLTHRLTAAEIAGGYLDANPDLHLLILDCSRSFASPLGDLADSYATNERRLVGPPGWLDAFEAGQLVAVSWRTTGWLSIDTVDPSGDGRVLVTEDAADFTRLAARWAQSGRDHAGIVVTPAARFRRRRRGYPDNLVRALAALLGDPPDLRNDIWWFAGH